MSSFVRMTLELLSPADALAEAPPMGERLRQLGKRLRRAVVTDNNAGNYQRDLGALLDAAAESTLTATNAPLPPNYRTMVRATAWQESCWRQFVVKHQRLRYLMSSTGDVGLMQVNKHVWRGFYSIPHLEWDIAYNAGAGSQILARLAVLAAAESGRNGSPAARARSAYACYNGGPDALNRWRQPHERRELRVIDESFWQKYSALTRGQSIDIMRCAANWGKAAGQ